jgi:DNA polymerase III alpha subunit
MLFVKIEDASISVELLIFPRLYKETSSLWIDGQAVIVEGVLSEKDQELKFLVNHALSLDTLNPAKSIDNFKRVIMAAGPAKKNYQSKYASGNYQNNKPINNVPLPEQIVKDEPKKILKKSIILTKKNNPLRLIFLQNLKAAELASLKDVFSRHTGEDDVYFQIIEAGKAKIIKTAYQVDNNEDLVKVLENDFNKLLKVVSWT